MPSTEHEGIVELFCNRPELLDLHHQLPRPRRSPEVGWVWKPDRSELTNVSPRELHADAVFKRMRAESDEPDLVVVFEVQRDRKEGKRCNWAMYLASAAYCYQAQTVLVVVCPDPGVAAWAREEFPTNVADLILRPIVIGPEDVPVILDSNDAVHPEQVVLSALMHGSRPDIRDQVFAALIEVVRTLPEELITAYTNAVYTTITPEAREDLKEAYMPLTYSEPCLFRDIARDIFKDELEEARREAEGRGEASAVLKVLHARGVDAPEDAREEILACQDIPTLDTWLTRAVTADRIEDVLGPHES